MKTAYFYDYQTFIYIGSDDIQCEYGYDEPSIPQHATWIETPDFDAETEQLKFDVDAQKWNVEKQFVKVTAYLKSDCTQSKEFDDKTLVTDDYTLKKPKTQFDEWIAEEWVTNLSNKHIDEYNRVDDTRRSLYARYCDPLKMEALDLIDDGDIDAANELKAQAHAAKAKIKEEHPWPPVLDISLKV